MSKDIIFTADGNEMMRFESDGKVYIRGELVDDNLEVYKAFAEWFSKANHAPLPTKKFNTAPCDCGGETAGTPHATWCSAFTQP